MTHNMYTYTFVNTLLPYELSKTKKQKLQINQNSNTKKINATKAKVKTIHMHFVRKAIKLKRKNALST